MSCGLEGLVLALQLAKETVRITPVEEGNVIYAVCICCAATESGRLSCLAARAAAEEQRNAEHDAKVREFRAIANKCEFTKNKERK